MCAIFSMSFSVEYHRSLTRKLIVFSWRNLNSGEYFRELNQTRFTLGILLGSNDKYEPRTGTGAGGVIGILKCCLFEVRRHILHCDTYILQQMIDRSTFVRQTGATRFYPMTVMKKTYASKCATCGTPTSTTTTRDTCVWCFFSVGEWECCASK